MTDAIATTLSADQACWSSKKHVELLAKVTRTSLSLAEVHGACATESLPVGAVADKITHPQRHQWPRGLVRQGFAAQTTRHWQKFYWGFNSIHLRGTEKKPENRNKLVFSKGKTKYHIYSCWISEEAMPVRLRCVPVFPVKV